AGHIIMPLIKEKGVKLLPVDSEHSAIFQCLHGEKDNPLEKIFLTCSGGPFRGKSLDELKTITPSDALKHPKWSMGRKITIDSATLVNKGLEVMEAMWLFDMPYEKIEVVVHPQSVIHSMVQFEDGSIKAQLGSPDMRVPIEYALFYPGRKHLSVERVDFFKLQSLTFEKPDLNTFKGLRLAFDALKTGGSAPTVYNAANEEAVRMFLSGELSFLGIADSIEKALDTVKVKPNPSLDEVLEIEKETRELVKAFK
ncbi:MAG: 1-deoxy-D-xylulose-5-phosphate reductoisomerase, partial [Lachnospiraceae bacterium]|nr:1-deoxy-D-xylulose-5-phosphate reductoisomerase [Lachnospiraceae bacterium]